MTMGALPLRRGRATDTVAVGVRVAVIAAVIIAAATGAELLLRWATPWNDPNQQLRFLPGPDRFPTLGPAGTNGWNVSIADGWRTRVAFDRFGLRQAGDVTRANPNAIFVVGDYFAFGWGVEEKERFAELLAAKLDTPVHDVAILGNLPQGNLKLVHYVESLGATVHRLLIALPMETVVQRYAGSPDMALPEREADFPSPARLEAAHVPLARYRAIAGMWRVPYDSLSGAGGGSSDMASVKLWMLEQSALYRAALRFVHSDSLLQGVASRLGLSEVRRPIQVNAEDAEATRITADLLAQIADRYQVLLAIVPSPAAWIAASREIERRRHAQFVAALAERGLAYCDLLPSFDDAGGIDMLAYPRELHWNAAAHKIAANALVSVAAEHWHIAPPNGCPPCSSIPSNTSSISCR
jgi:hypothetical protein